MGFFRRLMGQEPVPVAVATGNVVPLNAAPTLVVAPRRGVSYNAGLIDSLLRDHAELGRIFGEIGDTYKAGRFDDVRPLLVQLKTRLEAHVLTENVRFYNYLEQSLGSDSNDAGTMRSFRREMNGIARSLVEFVRKYQGSQFAPAERQAFAHDYDEVGKVLEQRFDSEENNLYPLYQPN